MADEQDKTVTAEKPKVKIEVFAWLTRYVGGDGGGRKFYTEEFTPGESLRTVVRRLSRNYPALDHILWDPETGQLGRVRGDHCERRLPGHHSHNGQRTQRRRHHHAAARLGRRIEQTHLTGQRYMVDQNQSLVAFLSVHSTKDGEGYLGGLLVTDETGIPKEFRCTHPVRPSATQKALYGANLKPHVLLSYWVYH